MKSFEDIWNEAEDLSKDSLLYSIDHIKIILNILEKEDLLNKDNSNKSELIGDMLFHIANISKIYNINVANALNNKNLEEKIDNYE